MGSHAWVNRYRNNYTLTTWNCRNGKEYNFFIGLGERELPFPTTKGSTCVIIIMIVFGLRPPQKETIKIAFQDCIFLGALPPQAPKKTSTDWTSLASRPPSSRWLHVVVLVHEDEVVGVPLTPHLLTYHEHIYTHLDFSSIVNLYLLFQDFSIF